MRRGTIQINNYFAKRAAGRADLLSPPRSDKVFRTLASDKTRGLPIRDAADELLAAWQLGIVTAVRQDGTGVTWAIDGQRLSDVSGEAVAQATEQLAAALAAAAEGLACSDYAIDISGSRTAAQYIDVFSTIYNALLARELGISRELAAHEQPHLSIGKSMDEVMRTRIREANELAESHGIRRMYKLQHEGEKMTKETMDKPATRAAQTEIADQLTVWRHVQDANAYKLEWYVELADSRPVHIACSIERGTEAQRAVIETYMLLANRRLEQAGTRGVAQLGTGIQSGYYGGDSPIDEFTTVFTTTFMTPEEQTQIDSKNRASAAQTDLLQSIEAVMCERCNNPIQQFGSYGICIHCGDAQTVKN